MSDDENSPVTTADMPGPVARLIYLVIAYVALGVALAGLVLPLLPALPFLLIAVWAGARGSPRLHAWIFDQPRLANMIYAWREERAIPLYAKWAASILIGVSWGILYWREFHWAFLVFMAALFVSILVYMWSRPEPRAR